MYTKTALALSPFLAALSQAAPASSKFNILERQYTGSTYCLDSTSYKVDNEEPFTGKWTPVSGDTCTSSNVDSCSVGHSDSVTLGVTVTVGGGIDIGEIFHADTSIAYSYSETHAEVISQTCPKGGYICGLVYQPQMVRVKGHKVITTGGTCVNAGDTRDGDDYEFEAPVLIGDPGTPEVRFAACISDASPKKDTENVGIDMCPDGV